MTRLSYPFLRSRLALLVTGVCALSFDSTRAGEHPGAMVYKKLCLECHGGQGQGVEGKYDEALAGERSVASLARYIEKNMPEDNEGTCVGEDAKQVAAYIYDSFYSPAAQTRLHPPAIDLSRLTIAQHRNSVMDVIGRFPLPPVQPSKPPVKFPQQIAFAMGQPGLKATFRGVELPKPGEPAVDTTPKKGIKAKRPNKTIDKIIPGVAFHFGADSPEKEVLEAEQFNNRFEGNIFAEETGLYEFIVKTENGTRLWINDEDPNNALIDAWVSNGPAVREEKKSIFLLGGRAYRLVLEHFKFKEQSASIELWWKPPQGVAEIIPQRVLHTDRMPERMIVSTSFPADDRSDGYERGTTISKEWDRAVTDAAISASELVVARIDKLAGLKAGAGTREEKLKTFAAEFVATAFRRPLTDEQRKVHVDDLFTAAKTPELAVKRVVLLALQSPLFLYPDLHGRQQPDDFDAASRLALALWDSIPDQALLQAADAHALHTPEQLRAQAQRMIADARTKAKLNGFFHHWLDLERAEATAKDPKAFPDFNEQVLADLRESLSRFINQVVWSEKSDYRELLQADYLLLNDRLGKFYGKPVLGEEFQRVSFDPKQRAGVVTHPYLLASLAYSKQSSPIHRGVFLTRNIVGMALKPPKKAVVFEESHFNPKLTMREKITELTSNDACMSCHRMINPLGFSLENFDAVGRWRTKDNNKPVNAVSEFSTDEGKTMKLTGPRDIANYVADNPSGHRAFIRHLFNHLVKQQAPAYGPKTLDDLQRSFAASGCSVQKLLVEIAVTAGMNGAPPK
jgi:Protein of unknown function (DUF1592)/Protein of unknown function (DUF1588)/PA14 domain/Cytochrome C oxidase, cbb3-type, subunit III